MDLPCPVCREPWDFDVLHEVAGELGLSYAEVAERFRTKGCGVAFAGSEYANRACAGPADGHLAALAELLGDDMDGYASMAEDFGLLD